MKRYFSKGITPEIAANLRELEAMGDNDIDFFDIPEIVDWSNAVRGKLYRPVKQQVTLRPDADLLHWFRMHSEGARGYQTRINAALRQFVDQEAKRAAG